MHMTWNGLCTKKISLCGKQCLSREGFLEDYYACVMAAFEEAGTCNMAGSASIKDFLKDMSKCGPTKDAPWMDA